MRARTDGHEAASRKNCTRVRAEHVRDVERGGGQRDRHMRRSFIFANNDKSAPAGKEMEQMAHAKHASTSQVRCWLTPLKPKPQPPFTCALKRGVNASKLPQLL
eukprot:6185333-Pleurochrysis_carterae.AAC.2